jgi:hypothetical protein
MSRAQSTQGRIWTSPRQQAEYRETPFAFLDDFDTALDRTRQGWYERACSAALTGSDPMQSPPKKKAKGAVSELFSHSAALF